MISSDSTTATALWFVAAALALAACTSANPTTSPATPGGTTAVGSDPSAPEVTVIEMIRVVDGDTLEVSIDGEPTGVRLIGINAAERSECYAGEATAALTEMMASGTPRLESDTSDTDQYGRLLRYLWVDDVLVNEALVAEGFAIARRYEPDTAYADRLDAAQRQARSDGQGLWAPDACGVVDPARFEFSAIVADPPGDDTLDLNGESVSLTNIGPSPADLGGWALRDESSSHRYVFEPGSVVPAGGTVVVRSGCGTDTPSEFFWCRSGSAIWNNGGDTAFLLDPSGNIATSLSTDTATD